MRRSARVASASGFCSRAAARPLLSSFVSRASERVVTAESGALVLFLAGAGSAARGASGGGGVAVATSAAAGAGPEGPAESPVAPPITPPTPEPELLDGGVAPVRG